jgi:8-oxo-dGTP pyrophosphatase MutT (NUDIX family)
VDYVRQIREKVGHDLVITVGCGAIVEDDDGRVLLQRRRDSDLWAIPGGLVEPGKLVEETMRREVFEETGLSLGPATFFGVYSGPEGFGGYPNGDRVFSVQIVLRAAAAASSRLCTSEEESVAHAFFSSQAFPSQSELHPHQRRILIDWLARAPGPFIR